MMKQLQLFRLTLLFLGVLTAGSVLAQPTVLGTQTVGGSYVTYDLSLRGGARFVRMQATSGASSGARNWEFATGTASSTNYSTNWRPYTTGQTLSGFNTIIDPSSATASARYNTSFGGQSGLMPAITANNYYTFIVGTNATSNNTMTVLETSYNPVSISSVAQSPSTVYAGQSVTVTATMASSLNSGEGVYLRYSTDGFSSSTVVAMSNTSGNDFAATIPNQINGVSVQYYVFTSNIASSTVTSNPGNADYYSLHIRTAGGLNIGGLNFTYTVNQWQTVSGATNWATAASWNANAIPSTTNSLGTVAVGHNISIDQNATVAAITMATSTTLTINSGSTVITSGGINSGTNTCNLTVNGTLQINGGGFVGNNTTVTYGSTGALTYNTGGAYGRSNEWPSTNGPVNVTISNSGTNVTLGAARTLTGTLTVNSGCTLTSSGNLTLAGSTTTPGRIGNSAGTVSGSVNVEIAIPGGRRAFRMIGNPLTTAQALTTLTDDIHITGTGGAANGFDATTNNSPSAFSFSESTFNGTNNSGWAAYTNTSQTIAANGAARIFYRGPRSQSGLLDGSNPTPNAGTLDLTGTVNSGTVNVAMGYTAGSGANAGWNLIPNPYPSNVDVGSIASGNRNSIANFAVWVPTSGTRGAYVSQSFGSSYIIPTGGAFFVQTGSAANFTFSESNKTASSVSANLLKTDPFKQNAFQINVTSNDTIFWDQYVFRHREGTQQGKDELDGPKMQNPDVNFFAKTNEGFNLAIDNRVVSNNMIVPLSFETGSDYNFTFTVPFINLPGVSVFLADKFLKTETELTEGMKYNFETSSDPASKGDGRFELLFKGSVNGKSELVNASLFSLYPNPATEQINLTLTHAAKGTFNYTIINQLGAQVMEGQFDATNYRNQSINVSELPAGVYFVNLNNGETSQTIKFIK